MANLDAAKSTRRSRIERGCGEPRIDMLAEDPLLRRSAIESLDLVTDAGDGSAGSLESAMWSLRAALADSHAPVRSAAAERLAQAGPALRDQAQDRSLRILAIAWLIEALADPMPSVREAACRALAALADHAEQSIGVEAATRLAEHLRGDPVWWVRRAAARALAAVAGAEAIDSLIPGLEDPFWRVRHGVVQALGLIVTRGGRDQGEREALRLRVLAAGEPLGEVARAALAYLAGGWPEGEDEVPEVLGIIRDPGAGLELADPDPAVVTARLQAARAGAVAVDELIPLLAESHVALRDEALRRLATIDAAAELLASLGPALAWLEDPRIPNAAAAVRTLLDRLGPRALDLARWALEQGRAGAIAWAARWVGMHPAEALHGRLLEHRHHAEPRVREAVLDGLGRILARERGRAPAIEAALVVGLGDDDEAVRGAAARGLAAARRAGVHVDAGILASLRAVDRLAVLADASGSSAILQRALGDDDGRVRALAVAALAARGALTDAQRTAATGDRDPLVREAALDLPTALAIVTAEPDPGDSPALRRAAARLVVRLAATLDDAPRERGSAALFASADPRLRVSALMLIEPAAAGPEALARLLLGSRDRTPMVRSAAADRLARVPDLAGRLDPWLGGRLDPWLGGRLDPWLGADSASELQLAAWSTLLCACDLDPEEAGARLDAGRRDAGPELRAHLEALGILLGRSVTLAAAEVRIVPRTGPPIVAAKGQDLDARATIHARSPLGRSGIELAPLVLSGAHGLSPASLAFAAEQGVDTFFWEPRYTGATAFLRQRSRRGLQVIAGSFHADRRGLLADLDAARRRLRREVIDLFLLFWVRSPARLGPEALAALREFQDRGWIRSYGFSTHERPIACEAITGGDWPVIMTRHSAAHTGAELELLPMAAAAGVGLLGFSALCYGRMLRASSVLARGPAAADCYRYSLSQPGVVACVSAPRRHRELVENLELLAQPHLDAQTQELLRAHGREVYADNKRFDRLLRRGGAAPLREAILELFDRAGPEPAGSEHDHV